MPIVLSFTDILYNNRPLSTNILCKLFYFRRFKLCDLLLVYNAICKPGEAIKYIELRKNIYLYVSFRVMLLLIIFISFLVNYNKKHCNLNILTLNK